MDFGQTTCGTSCFLLDFDHAGGLDDFPAATVHLLGDEIDGAIAQNTVIERMRYRHAQWGTSDQWRRYPSAQGEPWFGFNAVRGLDDIDDDVLLVPLVGHTLGHAGVAVKLSEGWLFYAADAYFFHGEMDLDEPRCPTGLRLYQTMMEKDRPQRLLNQQRLRDLKAAHGSEITIFCAHDVTEFEGFEPSSKPAERAV